MATEKFCPQLAPAPLSHRIQPLVGRLLLGRAGHSTGYRSLLSHFASASPHNLGSSERMMLAPLTSP